MTKPKTGATTTGPDPVPEPQGTIHVAGVPDEVGVQRCERCAKTLAAASEEKFRTEALLERFDGSRLAYFTGADVGTPCTAVTELRPDA